jgi:integrin alpha 7
MNSPEGLSPDAQRFKLVGEANEGRFGFALAHAGDLNNDGFDDVIIGAPYDGNGKVFVYLGGEKFGSSKPLGVPDQVLTAEQLPQSGIRTFGYSLGGGYDLDLNNHSDIVVGAYGSDTAFIIRSRPVIDIATWFKDRRINYIDPTLTGCETDVYSSEFCFTIESCYLIKNFPHNIASIHLRYSLAAELFPGGRRVSRIRFGDSGSNASHVSEKTVVVERGRLTGCFHETAYLKEGTVDLRTPVKFQMKLRLQQDEPRPQREASGVSNINYFPILNQQEAMKVLKVKFHESCGDDELCHSRLKASLAIGPGFDSDQGRLEIQYRQEIQLNVSVSNLNGEPAYSAELQLNIDPSFAYVGRSDDVSDIHCDFRGRGLGVHCRLGNPYASNRSDLLLFRVVPSQSSLFIHQGANFSVVTNTSSEDVGSASDHTQDLQVVYKI